MKTIFIDCGAYKGKLIRRFREKHPGTEFYAFECHPHFDKINYGDDVHTYRTAVWVYDGTMPLYVNHKTPGVEGHSAFADKTTNHIDPNNPIMVNCIDFDKWLKDNFLNRSDIEIHVKMNIEGAEYPILEHCLKRGSINLINFLYIQWHYMKIPSITEERHRNLVRELQGLTISKNFQLYHGYGQI